jgi:hypothetical protein
LHKIAIRCITNFHERYYFGFISGQHNAYISHIVTHFCTHFYQQCLTVLTQKSSSRTPKPSGRQARAFWLLMNLLEPSDRDLLASGRRTPRRTVASTANCFSRRKVHSSTSQKRIVSDCRQFLTRLTSELSQASKSMCLASSFSRRHFTRRPMMAHHSLTS